VVFLDIPAFGRWLEESLAWVITKDLTQWYSIPQWLAITAGRTECCAMTVATWRVALRFSSGSMRIVTYSGTVRAGYVRAVGGWQAEDRG
jgi:hypothetical protein